MLGVLLTYQGFQVAKVELQVSTPSASIKRTYNLTYTVREGDNIQYLISGAYLYDAKKSLQVHSQNATTE